MTKGGSEGRWLVSQSEYNVSFALFKLVVVFSLITVTHRQVQ